MFKDVLKKMYAWEKTYGLDSISLEFSSGKYGIGNDGLCVKAEKGKFAVRFLISDAELSYADADALVEAKATYYLKSFLDKGI